MECPEHLHKLIAETISIETESARSKRHWAVVLGLKPKLDGDRWCLLWGDDIQSGVCAFGTTPEETLRNFDKAMYEVAKS